MTAFLVVLIGFGFYGLYDATQAYPARGRRHASYLQYQYLEAAKSENLSDAKTTVGDPVGELKRLNEKGGEKLPGAEGARFAWLSALEVVNGLTPKNTSIPNPSERLAELRKEWTSSTGARSAPKALSRYDIYVQWLFTAIGLGGGLLMLIHIARVLSRKYRWDPETKQLQLADGSTLTPDDIEEFDKRKWDKYLIFLKIKEGHGKYACKELKLDLYQHAPLEAWVLEMEKIAFPDREPPAGTTPASPTPSPEPAPAA
jgi:hypothetical protein